ncbi:MAG: hypothetical protein LUD78_11495 [Clostridiales bacterium]|nr:hypothetical protein [Clostridiales bacterium]
MKPYLTEEEQFKPILNNEEIERIEDYELRQIRSKYWKKQADAFLDEAHISDAQYGEVMEQIRIQEQAELEEYKRRREKKQ